MKELVYQYYNKGLLAFSALTGIYGLSTGQIFAECVGGGTLILGFMSAGFSAWRNYYEMLESRTQSEIAEIELSNLQKKQYESK